MSIVKNRIAAVAVGATIVVGLGATGAVAADLITSQDIQDGTIRSVDIANGAVTGGDVRDDTIRKSDIADGAVGQDELTNGINAALVPGIRGLQADSLAAPTLITHIGGPINDNNTNLDTGFTLPAGRYLVTVDGQFDSATAAADPSIDVWPQLSLWIDRNHDEAFHWQDGEGDISPNVLMPDPAERSATVSGQTIVELTEDTYVGLLAFGYDSNQGTARSGEIGVTFATITATPLP